MDTKPDEVATSPTVTTPTKVFTQPSVASSLYQDTGLPLEEIKEGFGGERMSGNGDVYRVKETQFSGTSLKVGENPAPVFFRVKIAFPLDAISALKKT